jgi:glycosyltransferase involved in cell wall biosynthesis
MSETIVAIIPLYNGAKYIRSAIESILAQGRQPDEIVIVDDGSTDNGEGAAIVSEFTDKRVKLLSKENGGQGSARNFGVRHSTADLIAFLDQDDLWYAHHLEELEKPFLQNSRLPLGWVYSNLDEINGRGQMVCHSYLDIETNEHPKRTLIGCLKQDMFILPGASLISREAFEAVGGFDEQFMGYEDDDLFLRMFCQGYRNIFIDQPLTIWRIHAGSTSYGRLMAQSRMRYFTKLVAMFPDDPQLSRFYARQYFVPRFVRSVVADLRSGMSLNDHERVEIACSHLWQLSGHLSARRKLPLRMLAVISRRPVVGRMVRMLPRGAANRLRIIFGV